MADGFASTFDKFGASAPRAPDSQGSGPSAHAAPFVAVCPPAPAHWENKPGQAGDKPADSAQDRLDEKREQLQQSKPFENSMQDNKPTESKPAEGLHSFSGFKPVEVMSVPDTPVNGSTPAGASPRPELKINEEPSAPPEQPKDPVIEPIEKPETEAPKPAFPTSAPANEPPAPPAATSNEPLVLTGTQEPKPTPATSVPVKEPFPASVSDKDGDTVMNGAPKVSELEAAAAPVTHAGPTPDSVPAPAPAPAAAPVSEPAPIPEAPKASEPAPAEPSIGDKRKLEEDSAAAPTASGLAGLGGFTPATAKPLADDNAPAPDAGPFEKKAKLDDGPVGLGGSGISKPEPATDAPKPSVLESAPAPAPAAPAATGTTSVAPTVMPAPAAPAEPDASLAAPVTEPAPAAAPVKAPALDATDSAPKPKAPPKPKKEKKAPVVGRTARKTRSQGPVDA